MKIYLVAQNNIQQDGIIVAGNLHMMAMGNIVSSEADNTVAVANNVNIMAANMEGTCDIRSSNTSIVTTQGDIDVSGNLGHFAAKSARDVSFDTGSTKGLDIAATTNNVNLANLMLNESGNIVTEDASSSLKSISVNGKP